MELKIVNSFYLLSRLQFLQKSSIADVRLGFEDVSGRI